MRYSILLLLAFLAFACSSKNTHQDDAEIITRIGVIAAKEDASVNDVEKDTRTRTSVYGSVSSGGNFSIGVGVLLSSFFSGDSEPELVRYEVDLKDGGQFTIYLDSPDFEVDDCVEITVHPNEEKYPPTMKRKKGAC
ncbi:MAG: hypothetical protein OES20_07865 [Gammaproteobacteria bacterium]|nr:hypothetical protein [Gammaproteobacteria bacterium]